MYTSAGTERRAYGLVHTPAGATPKATPKGHSEGHAGEGHAGREG